MARKNSNARGNVKRFPVPKNFHFLYSTDDEFGTDATVVRYMGEQDGEFLLCFHPEGYALWIHCHQLSNIPKVAA